MQTNILPNNAELYMYYEVPDQSISKIIYTDKNDVILSMVNILIYKDHKHKVKNFTDDFYDIAEAYGRYIIRCNTPRDCYSKELKETLIKACSGCEESSDLLYEYTCAFIGLEIGDNLFSDRYDPEDDCCFTIEDDLNTTVH